MASADGALNDGERDALAGRWLEVRRRVEGAATRAGRPAPLLIAVSKGQSASAVRAAYALGQRDFGENYVQELTQKAAALADLAELRWHVIGHLQRNKVKVVVEHAQAVHSVDSPALAAELDKRMTGREVPARRRVFGDDGRLPVLAEVSIAGEAQKSGCEPRELVGLLTALEAAPALRLVGLMCVPPFDAEPEASGPYFAALARLRDEHGGRSRLPELSMGMTADFEHAIAAGATVVRVGTAIFGPRAPRVGGE